MTTQQQAINQIIKHGIDNLEGQEETEASELHHHLYNEDYFIIGYYNADKFLELYGVMEAIRMIQQYERDNFGDVTTDLGDSEKVANMLAYIIGEEVLYSCETLQNQINDDATLSDVDIAQIKTELQEQIV